ncbi:MAG: LysR family transcriptional regulator [Hyphomicrobiales bacterium]|nr:LysR family transcriptional regulator [Hyphomicrobiales bacterium]
MPKLSLRVDLNAGQRIGPGKIALLEKIAAHGSIAAAGRALDMSYRRAWELVAALNEAFGKPVVEQRAGGRSGGGARITPFGLELIARYRAIEQAALDAAATHLEALQKEAARAGVARKPR